MSMSGHINNDIALGVRIKILLLILYTPLKDNVMLIQF